MAEFNLGTATARLNVDYSGLTSGIRQAQGEVERGLQSMSDRAKMFGQNMRNVGVSLVAMTAPLNAFAAAGVKTAATFEDSIAEISARTATYGEDLQRVSDVAKQMGQDTIYSAQEAVGAMLELTTSGQTTAEAIETIPHVLNLAAAGGTNLGFAADALTDIMKQFRMDTGEVAIVANVLTQAAAISSASVGDLVRGYQGVGALAKNMGLTVNQTAGALAILAENGIKSAQAGTSLRSMLTNMVRPTEQVDIAWHNLGTSFYDAEGQARDLGVVMEEVGEGLAKMTDLERDQTLQNLFGTYGKNAAMALIYGDSLEEVVISMSKQALASEVAQARMETFSGEVNSLRGSFEGLMIEALTPFMNDILKPLVIAIKNVVNVIATWARENPGLTKVILTLSIALGGLGAALTVLGQVIIFVAPALGTIAGIVGGITAPMIALTTAVGILGFAWANNFMGIRRHTQRVFDKFGELVRVVFRHLNNVRDYIFTVLNSILTAVYNVGHSILDFIKGLAKTFALAFLAILQTTIDSVKRWINELLRLPQTLGNFFENLFADINSQGLLYWVRNQLRSVLNAVRNAIRDFLRDPIGSIVGVVEWINDNILAPFFQSFVSVDTLNALGVHISNELTKLWDRIRLTAEGFWRDITNPLAGKPIFDDPLLEFAKPEITRGMRKQADWLWEDHRYIDWAHRQRSRKQADRLRQQADYLDKLYEDYGGMRVVSEAPFDAETWAQETIQSITDFFTDPFGNIGNWITAFANSIAGVINGIREGISQGITNIHNAIINAIREFLGLEPLATELTASIKKLNPELLLAGSDAGATVEQLRERAEWLMDDSRYTDWNHRVKSRRAAGTLNKLADDIEAGNKNMGEAYQGVMYASAGMVDWVSPTDGVIAQAQKDAQGPAGNQFFELGQQLITDIADSFIAGIRNGLSNMWGSVVAAIKGFFTGYYVLPSGSDPVRPEDAEHKAALDKAVAAGILVYRPWFHRHAENVASWFVNMWNDFWGGISDAITEFFTPENLQPVNEVSSSQNKMQELSTTLPVIDWNSVTNPMIEQAGRTLGDWINKQWEGLWGWVVSKTGIAISGFFAADYLFVNEEPIVPKDAEHKKNLDAAVKAGWAIKRPWLQRHIENIYDWLGEQWNLFINGLVTGVTEFFSGDTVADPLTKPIDKDKPGKSILSSDFASSFNIFRAIFDTTNTRLRPFLQKHIENFHAWLGSLWDGLWEFVISTFNIDTVSGFFAGDYTVFEGQYGDKNIQPRDAEHKAQLDKMVEGGVATYRPWMQRHIENVFEWLSEQWDNFWGGIREGILRAFYPDWMVDQMIGEVADTQYVSAGIVDWTNPAEMLPEITEDMWGMVQKPGIETWVEGIGIWIGNTLDSLLSWLLGDFFKGDYTVTGMEWLLGDRIIEPEEGFTKNELDAAVARGYATFRPWLVRHIETIAGIIKGVWDFAWQAIGVGVALALLPFLAIADLIHPPEKRNLFGAVLGTQVAGAGVGKTGAMPASLPPIDFRDIPDTTAEPMKQSLRQWISDMVSGLFAWVGSQFANAHEWLLVDYKEVQIITDDMGKVDQLTTVVHESLKTQVSNIVRKITDPIKEQWDSFFSPSYLGEWIVSEFETPIYDPKAIRVEWYERHTQNIIDWVEGVWQGFIDYIVTAVHNWWAEPSYEQTFFIDEGGVPFLIEKRHASLKEKFDDAISKIFDPINNWWTTDWTETIYETDELGKLDAIRKVEHLSPQTIWQGIFDGILNFFSSDIVMSVETNELGEITGTKSIVRPWVVKHIENIAQAIGDIFSDVGIWVSSLWTSFTQSSVWLSITEAITQVIDRLFTGRVEIPVDMMTDFHPHIIDETFDGGKTYEPGEWITDHPELIAQQNRSIVPIVGSAYALKRTAGYMRQGATSWGNVDQAQKFVSGTFRGGFREIPISAAAVTGKLGPLVARASLGWAAVIAAVIVETLAEVVFVNLGLGIVVDNIISALASVFDQHTGEDIPEGEKGSIQLWAEKHAAYIKNLIVLGFAFIFKSPVLGSFGVAQIIVQAIRDDLGGVTTAIEEGTLKDDIKNIFLDARVKILNLLNQLIGEDEVQFDPDTGEIIGKGWLAHEFDFILKPFTGFAQTLTDDLFVNIEKLPKAAENIRLFFDNLVGGGDVEDRLGFVERLFNVLTNVFSFLGTTASDTLVVGSSTIVEAGESIKRVFTGEGMNHLLAELPGEKILTSTLAGTIGLVTAGPFGAALAAVLGPVFIDGLSRAIDEMLLSDLPENERYRTKLSGILGGLIGFALTAPTGLGIISAAGVTIGSAVGLGMKDGLISFWEQNPLAQMLVGGLLGTNILFPLVRGSGKGMQRALLGAGAALTVAAGQEVIDGLASEDLGVKLITAFGSIGGLGAAVMALRGSGLGIVMSGLGALFGAMIGGAMANSMWDAFHDSIIGEPTQAAQDLEEAGEPLVHQIAGAGFSFAESALSTGLTAGAIQQGISGFDRVLDSDRLAKLFPGIYKDRGEAWREYKNLFGERLARNRQIRLDLAKLDKEILSYQKLGDVDSVADLKDQRTTLAGRLRDVPAFQKHWKATAVRNIAVVSQKYKPFLQTASMLGATFAFMVADAFWDSFGDFLYSAVPEEMQIIGSAPQMVQDAAAIGSTVVGGMIGWRLTGNMMGMMLGAQAASEFLPAFFDAFVGNLVGEYTNINEKEGAWATGLEATSDMLIGIVSYKSVQGLLPSLLKRVGLVEGSMQFGAFRMLGAAIASVIVVSLADHLVQGMREEIGNALKKALGIEMEEGSFGEQLLNAFTDPTFILGAGWFAKTAAGRFGLNAAVGLTRFSFLSSRAALILGHVAVGALAYIGVTIASVIIIAIVEALTAGIGPAIDEGTRQGIINAQFGGSAFRYMGSQMGQHMSGSPLVDRSQTGAEIGHLLTDPNYFADQIPVRGYFGGGPMTGGIRRNWALVKFDQAANTFTVMQTDTKDDPLRRKTFSAADVDIRIITGLYEDIHRGDAARAWAARIAQGGVGYQDAWMRNRDEGGPGKAGVPYLIGTGAQPEIFIPGEDGYFFPNVDEGSTGILSSAGGIMASIGLFFGSIIGTHMVEGMWSTFSESFTAGAEDATQETAGTGVNDFLSSAVLLAEDGILGSLAAGMVFKGGSSLTNALPGMLNNLLPSNKNIRSQINKLNADIRKQAPLAQAGRSAVLSEFDVDMAVKDYQIGEMVAKRINERQMHDWLDSGERKLLFRNEFAPKPEFPIKQNFSVIDTVWQNPATKDVPPESPAMVKLRKMVMDRNALYKQMHLNTSGLMTRFRPIINMGTGVGALMAGAAAGAFWDSFGELLTSHIPEDQQIIGGSSEMVQVLASTVSMGVGWMAGMALTGNVMGAMLGAQAASTFLPALFDGVVGSLMGEYSEIAEDENVLTAGVEATSDVLIGTVFGKAGSALVGKFGPKLVGRIGMQLAGPRLKALQMVGGFIGMIIGTTAGDNLIEGLGEGLKIAFENITGVEIDDTIIEEIFSQPLATLAGFFGGKALGKAAAGWIGSQAGRLGVFAGVSKFLGGAAMGVLGFIGAGIASVIIISIVESLTAGIGPAIDEGTRQGIINAQFGGSAFHYMGDYMGRYMSGNPFEDRKGVLGPEIAHMLTSPDYFADQIPIQGTIGGERRQWALATFDQTTNTFTIKQSSYTPPAFFPDQPDPLQGKRFSADDVDIRVLTGFFEDVHRGDVARQWQARLAQGGQPYQDAWMRNRDKGGPGKAGTPYLIGTGAQPEIFIPGEDGYFFPNVGEDSAVVPASAGGVLATIGLLFGSIIGTHMSQGMWQAFADSFDADSENVDLDTTNINNNAVVNDFVSGAASMAEDAILGSLAAGTVSQAMSKLGVFGDITNMDYLVNKYPNLFGVGPAGTWAAYQKQYGPTLESNRALRIQLDNIDKQQDELWPLVQKDIRNIKAKDAFINQIVADRINQRQIDLRTGLIPGKPFGTPRDHTAADIVGSHNFLDRETANMKRYNQLIIERNKINKQINTDVVDYKTFKQGFAAQRIETLSRRFPGMLQMGTMLGSMMAFSAAGAFWEAFGNFLYSHIPEDQQIIGGSSEMVQVLASTVSMGAGWMAGMALTGNVMGAMLGAQAASSFLPALFDGVVGSLMGEYSEIAEDENVLTAGVEATSDVLIGTVFGKAGSALVGKFGPQVVGRIGMQLAGPRLKALQMVGGFIGMIIGTTAGDNLIEGLGEGLKVAFENITGVEIDDTIIENIFNEPLAMIGGYFGGQALGKAAAGWIGAQAGRLGVFAGVAKFLGGAAMGVLGFIGAGIASVIIISIVESLTKGIGPAIDEGTRQGIINAQFGGRRLDYLADISAQHYSIDPTVDRKGHTLPELMHMYTDPQYFGLGGTTPIAPVEINMYGMGYDSRAQLRRNKDGSFTVISGPTSMSGKTFSRGDIAGMDIRVTDDFFRYARGDQTAWEALLGPAPQTLGSELFDIRDRDKGGPGRAGMAYLIGTGAQPELFIPSVDGHFFPNFASDRLNYHMGTRTSMSQRDGDSMTYNVTINATVDPSTGTPENVGDRLGRAFKRRVERL